MKRSLLLVMAVLIPTVLFAQGAKLAPELQRASGTQMVPVIVQYKSTTVTAQPSTMLLRGVTVTGQLGLINGVRALVPVGSLAGLASDPNVAYVSPDRLVRGRLNNATAGVLANYAWGIGLSGSNVGVAVIDSGIHEADDIKSATGNSRILASFDYTGEGSDDFYGHGTHVAGIIGGNGIASRCATCSVTIQGIAPNVNLISFKVLNRQGEGMESAVIQAIQAAIQLKATYNIRVMNLSLGHPVFESYKQDPLCLAVEQAWKAGIVVVVAAGNGGPPNGIWAPKAAWPSIF